MLADMPSEQPPLDVGWPASGEIDKKRETLALIEVIGCAGGKGEGQGEDAKAQA